MIVSNEGSSRANQLQCSRTFITSTKRPFKEQNGDFLARSTGNLPPLCKKSPIIRALQGGSCVNSPFNTDEAHKFDLMNSFQ